MSTTSTVNAQRVGLLITTDGSARALPFTSESGMLKTLQSAVGGLIDVVTLPDINLALVINDEGKILGLPANPTATALYCLYRDVFDVIAGDVVVIEAGTGPRGESIGILASVAAALVSEFELHLL